MLVIADGVSPHPRNMSRTDGWALPFFYMSECLNRSRHEEKWPACLRTHSSHFQAVCRPSPTHKFFHRFASRLNWAAGIRVPTIVLHPVRYSAAARVPVASRDTKAQTRPKMKPKQSARTLQYVVAWCQAKITAPSASIRAIKLVTHNQKCRHIQIIEHGHAWPGIKDITGLANNDRPI